MICWDMASPSVPALVLSLSLLLSACPEKQKPAESSTVVPTYERASEAVKRQIPPGSTPVDPGVRNLQKGLEEMEKKQDEHLKQAEKGGAQQ
jgi:hypothetical protein